MSTGKLDVNNAIELADPRAFELLCAEQALKHPEELASISHVETRAVVPNRVRHLAFARLGADLDLGTLFSA